MKKFKVLKMIRLDVGGKLVDYSPDSVIEDFNNSQIFVELGYIVPFFVESAKPEAAKPSKVEHEAKPEGESPKSLSSDDLKVFTRQELKDIANELGVDPSLKRNELIGEILKKA